MCYIERPPIEQTCYSAIVKQGGLIRIKAPQKMGKTLLLGKVLDYAREQDYRTVKINFTTWDNNILEDYDRFLKAFCYEISSQLKINSIDKKIKTEWNGILPSAASCTNYFEKYILSENNNNFVLVLGLDHFEVLFENKQTFESFCSLLRAWHEKTKSKDDLGIKWRRFRLVIVNSTSDYPKLDRNHSPFYVGIEVNEKIGLKGFELSQTKQLLSNYDIKQSIADQDLQQLIELVDGHPFLIKESFCYLQQNPETSIKELLEKATTDEGIFIHYLREIAEVLDNNEELKNAYNRVITENRVEPDSKLSFNLQSLGLIKFDSNYSVSSCDLYLQYFLVHNFLQEFNQILNQLSTKHPKISKSEAQKLLKQQFQQKLNSIQTQQPQNLEFLKKQLLDRERWFRSGKKTLVAIVDYYISNSVIYKAGLAFLDEFGTD